MVYLPETERKFLRAIQELLPDDRNNKKFLLAVSGGADSMVMMRLFLDAGLKFEAAHCNYGLRGEDSDNDEQLVRRISADYGVRCHVKCFELANKHDGSIQLLARQLRYEWFEELRRENDLDYIATAHHEDDNTETVLFNFIRGTGIRGLTGIPTVKGHIIRPMLSITKQEILEYAAKNAVEYRDDLSNFTTKYRRNQIRLRLLPGIREINHNFNKTIREHIREYADLDELVQAQVGQFLKNSCRWEYDLLYISHKDIYALPGRFNILSRILEPFGFSKNQVLFLLEGRLSKTGTRIESVTHELVLHADEWLVASVVEEFEEIQVTTLPAEVTTTYGTLHFTEISQEEQAADKNILILQHDLDANPLSIRTRSDGDRFAPEGMQGQRQKLKDYFTNNKIPPPARDRQLLLCAADKILWIAGMRRSHFTSEENSKGKWIRAEFRADQRK